MVNDLSNELAPIVCSRLTAAGRGAIAVVQVTGCDAAKAIESVFQPFSRRPFSDHLHRNLVYGTWTPTGEDVVVCVLPDDRFEIHCHGGTAAVDSIVATLVDQGSVETSSVDLGGKCLWWSEIWRTLPEATTERTASLVLQQLELLPKAIERLQDTLAQGDVTGAVRLIDQILDWSDFGLSMTQVPSVVLCGQPNVGKSSLINAVVGFQRAIVHSSAGTTRDVVSQRTAVAGWPIEISDTAGLRSATGTVEGIGIENARQKIEAARLVIGVFDASEPWSETDQELLDRLDCDILIHNKSDRSKQSDASDSGRPPGLATSAVKNEGIEQMIALIAEKLVPELPPDDAAWCVNAAAVKRLQDARECLVAGEEAEGDRFAHAAKLLSGG